MKKKTILTHYLIHGIIILSFIFAWLAFSLYFASRYSFSVITSAYNSSNFTDLKTDEMKRGEKATAEFEAKENNLGIVSVRFHTYGRINDDVVKFRIKEKGNKKWFYENSYKVDQFQPDDYFTFGFPIISDSQNKSYSFEIESTKGKKGDAVAISKINPAFTAQYQYSKQELLANKTMLPEFLAKKIYYSFSDINFGLSSFVYLLPLVYYLFWYFLIKPIYKFSSKPFPKIKVEIDSQNAKNSFKKMSIFFHMYFIAILLLIVFLGETNNYVYFMLIGLWVLLSSAYRLESSVSFLIGLFLLMLCPLLIILNQLPMAERSAIWSYFFLVVATIQSMIEFRKKPESMVRYDEFLKNTFRR